MHYSRVSTSQSESYSAASAVLLNELLKGSISFIIAFSRVDANRIQNIIIDSPSPSHKPFKRSESLNYHLLVDDPHSHLANWNLSTQVRKCRKLAGDIFSPDCWKLSIPAILYVIQNNLQFVAASNLDVATFQVTYQMKILTTAAFSVALLRRKLSASKWAALLFLAIGVGVVQIQSGRPSISPAEHNAKSQVLEGSTSFSSAHFMNPLKGFLAVSAACLTSGLAGVYFEMVLKGSKADLWVRNVQLSLFSLLPALAPILFDDLANPGQSWSLFQNFGFWAWATVVVQVFGGLVTAVVIKYSDNIMKGFATSLSIIFSFLASVALFDFRITPSFIIGAATVLTATAMYNSPETSGGSSGFVDGGRISSGLGSILGLGRRNRHHGTPLSPGAPDGPIIGEYFKDKKISLSTLSPAAFAAALGFPSRSSPSPPSISPRRSFENDMRWMSTSSEINSADRHIHDAGQGLLSPLDNLFHEPYSASQMSRTTSSSSLGYLSRPPSTTHSTPPRHSRFDAYPSHIHHSDDEVAPPSSRTK